MKTPRKKFMRSERKVITVVMGVVVFVTSRTLKTAQHSGIMGHYAKYCYKKASGEKAHYIEETTEDSQDLIYSLTEEGDDYSLYVLAAGDCD